VVTLVDNIAPPHNKFPQQCQLYSTEWLTAVEEQMQMQSIGFLFYQVLKNSRPVPKDHSSSSHKSLLQSRHPISKKIKKAEQLPHSFIVKP